MAEEKAGRVSRVGGYFAEVRGEMRKVTWPTRGELYGATFVVVTVTMLLSFVLGVGDSLLGWIVEALMASRR